MGTIGKNKVYINIVENCVETVYKPANHGGFDKLRQNYGFFDLCTFCPAGPVCGVPVFILA